MNQIFNVSISKRDGSLTSADLTLPATPYQLADALEQLRADSAENVKAKISYCHSSGILNLLPTASGNLYEVNELAKKMSGFEDWRKEAFDGMLKTDALNRATRSQSQGGSTSRTARNVVMSLAASRQTRSLANSSLRMGCGETRKPLRKMFIKDWILR